MKLSPLLLLSIATLLACGDDTSSGGAGTGAGGAGTGAASAGGSGGESTGGGSTGGGGQGAAGGTGGAGAGGTGGGACIDASGFVYGEGMGGEPECLTFESASTFCGFAADGAICEFAVTCGISKSEGQCEINCEQGSSSFCNEPADVDCVIAAYCANDCAALTACEFIL